MIVSTGFVTIDVVDKRVIPKYIYYKLISPEITSYLINVASTTVSSYPSITPSDIAELEIDVPVELDQQKRIVNFLSNIENRLKITNTISEELESMAKTIYDYWFLQFEFPDKDGKPYKSNGGKMVWNEQLKQEIPVGWKVDNLYKIADFINGIACQKYRPLDNKHKLPVIKITEMHDGFTSKTEFVRDSISKDHIINNGDILFSWSASLETMIWNYGKGGLNQHIF